LRKNINILILLFLIIPGCGLFSTRGSEAPTESRSNFIPPTSPDIVLVNLQSAISEKNLNNYLLCFVDSTYSTRRYSYTADLTSQIQYPVFRTWQLTNENAYFRNLLALMNSDATSILFYKNSSQPIVASDTAIFYSEYLLRVDHQKTTVPKTLTGTLRFIMSADSRNLWAIHNWIDFKSVDSDTTWSVLKANFSN
jgi:hypothetical protein